MSDRQTALVLATVSGEQEQDAAKRTEFGDFLTALRSKQLASQQIATEAVVWCDEPLDTIVLSGAWVVMQKLAQILGENLTTAHNAESVAKRVNRLLEAGILLVYMTPQVAADRFFNEVILLVRRAQALGYAPGMDVPMNAWKRLLAGDEREFVRALPMQYDASKPGKLIDFWLRPSAMFFANLVKTARDYRARLEHIRRRIETENLIARAGAIEVLAITNGMWVSDTLALTLYFLDETSDDNAPLPSTLIAAELMGVRTLTEISAFRAFRIVPTNMAKHTAHLVSVNNEWLSTQVLLAFTDEDEGVDELPSASAYLTTLRAVHSSSDAEVTAKTLSRLNRRLRRKLDDAEKEAVERAIATRITEMRKWDAERIGIYTPDAVFVRLKDSDILLDHETALAIAKDEEIVPHKSIRKSNVDMKAWLFRVVSSIVWEQITETDAKKIARVGVLPVELVVEILDRCDARVARAYVQEIMNGHTDKKALNLLIRAGHVNITPDLINARVADFDTETLATKIPEIFAVASEADRQTMCSFWVALGNTPSEAARALVNERSRRKSLCVVCDEVVRSQDVLLKTTDKVHETLGGALFTMLLLGSAALALHEMRNGGKEARDVPWIKVFDNRTDVLPLRALGANATKEDALKLLRDVPETEARRWVGIE
jgi:hypothetical protein